MLFHICEILHLFIKKPQHSQSNPTFPQCPTVELSHPQRPALSQSHFKVQPKEASDLKPAAAVIPWSESSSPEVTGWDHHLMVCKTPTYLCENKPFITHMQTGYEKMTSKSRGLSPVILCPWAILLSQEACDIFCVGGRFGGGDEQPQLNFVLKLWVT